MKKFIAAVLTLVLLCSSAFAFAEAAPTPDLWTCPNCGREGNDGNFCPMCAQPKPPQTVSCPNCGKEYDKGLGYLFCPNCAAPLTAVSAGTPTEPDGESKALIRWEIAGDELDVGDMAFFGAYEQDGSDDNGPETIEWMVLEVVDGKALLLSRYLLEDEPYNETFDETVTWETCSLRTWLNDTFLGAAFSPEEQALILTSAVDNSDRQDTAAMECKPGGVTYDRVFLLSFREASEVYFTDDMARRCSPTVHAVDNGAYSSGECPTAEGEETTVWWLRSPCLDDDGYAGCVFDNGHVNFDDVTDEEVGVRPALWVSIDTGVY